MTKEKTAPTFYEGVDEIGGNKVLLEDKETKVFLDLGHPSLWGRSISRVGLRPGRAHRYMSEVS
jgi:hypothetical protein